MTMPGDITYGILFFGGDLVQPNFSPLALIAILRELLHAE